VTWSILVTEQITYDFGSSQRYGIIRAIPVRLRYNGTYDRIYDRRVSQLIRRTPRPVHRR
jgi:hypothetical protein